jgi:RNA polymerase sigma-70 factor (ECF subfamily)
LVGSNRPEVADFLTLPTLRQWNVRIKMTRKTDSLSSEDLMAEVAGGDDYAFEILVQRHQASVLNLIYRFIGDRTMAKDLAQEVFVRVWQAAKSYKPKAKFSTWIYRIAVNLCLNELKSVKRRSLIPLGTEERPDSENPIPADVSQSPEDLLLAKERSRQIAEALHSLAENQRMALILKRYDNLPYDEIGRVMGCSVSAVESLLVRAKKNLQEKLINPPLHSQLTFFKK